MFKKYELSKVDEFKEKIKFYVRHNNFQFLFLAYFNLFFLSFLSLRNFIMSENIYSFLFFFLNGVANLEVIKGLNKEINKDLTRNAKKEEKYGLH